MATAVQTSGKEQYLADIDRIRTQVAPDWLKTLREAAAERFGALDMPHSKMEAWRFTSIQPIKETAFTAQFALPSLLPSEAQIAPFLYHEQGWIELVFVNGFYAPGLSKQPVEPTAVTACGLADAIENADESVQQALQAHLDQHLLQTADGEGGGSIFTALNSSLLLDGAFVHVPRNAVLEHPIHLLFITTEHDNPAVQHPRNLYIVGECAEATFIESHVHLNGESVYFNNVANEIVLEPAANVHHNKVIDEGKNAYHLATTRVYQDRDSQFKAQTITNSGAIVRNELSVLLNGEGAGCSLNGLYMEEDKQLVDNPISIQHAKPHCTSWIGYKGILNGSSRGVFTGKIHVDRYAQKTDSNQLNQNLLLSEKAQIDTKPQLEIYADDVKCTHGATIGQHPKELVFYFQTRGMSEAMARAILTYGFADEVVQELEVDALRDRMERLVFNKYSPGAHAKQVV